MHISLRPMDCSPPGSTVHDTLQARILEWVAISCSRGSSRSRHQTHIFCISCNGQHFLYLATREAQTPSGSPFGILDSVSENPGLPSMREHIILNCGSLFVFSSALWKPEKTDVSHIQCVLHKLVESMASGECKFKKRFWSHQVVERQVQALRIWA